MAGNFLIAGEAQTLSIKDFYGFYVNSNRGDKNFLFTTKVKLPRGTYLNLEVFINEASVCFFIILQENLKANFSIFQYKDRLIRAEGLPSLVSSNRSKRRPKENSLQSSNELASTVKRRRSGMNILFSLFWA